MITVQLGYEVVGTQYVDVEIDEDELEKPWDEMNDDEKMALIMEDYEPDAFNRAMRECEFDLGGLFCIKEDSDGFEIYCQ